VQLNGSHRIQIGMEGLASVLLRSSLSNTLAIMDRRLMCLYDVTSVGGFPCLDIMTI
jgi:hypothetical protein